VAGPHGGREVALSELRTRLEDGLARKRLTKIQLAAQTALGRTTVHAAFQHDGPVPSAATVAALAARLGLPVEELLELRRAATGEASPVPVGEEGVGKPIGQWDPHDLEVHPAGTTAVADGSGARTRRQLPGYVRRAHDQVLAAAAGEAAAGLSRMLVLVGSSSTGKTRACWEAVQALADRGWRLWHPHDPTRAEAALAELNRVAPRSVVWLNEAQHYLGHPQLGERIAAALHTLLTDADRGPVLVLGTLWPEYADSYALLPSPSEPDPHSRVRELLTGRIVTVPDAFDQEALDVASSLAQDGDGFMADALTRASAHGRLAQELAGAPELLRRYEHGTPPVKALLDAAMDARRLGVGLHLPQAFLIDAATDYLSDHDYDQLADDWAEAAFADVARPVHGKQAPLRRTTARRPRRSPMSADTMPVPAMGPVFRLADYLEQHGRITRRRLCPPTSFWHAAHTHLTDADDLNNLAEAAYSRHRLQWAHHLWRRAAHAGDPKAVTALARMRWTAGDWEGAEGLFQRAVDAGDLLALRELARMREEAGDREGAEALLRRAADTDDSHALRELARMREEAGDREGAEAFARRAADAGLPFTLQELAQMREEAGDREGAEALLRRTVDAGYPKAVTALARMRWTAGDWEGAEGLLRRAVDAGDSLALRELARMRGAAGDREGAEAFARRAADAGLPFALQELTLMREEAGDREGAEAFARRAADAGLRFALLELMQMREEAGDREGAEALLRRAADAGHPDAMTALALMREGAGDQEGAEALLRRAADADELFALPALALMRARAGDREDAEALAWRAADAGNAAALLNLARIWEGAGDREGAEALALRVTDAGIGFGNFTSRWRHGLDPDGSPTPDIPWNSDSR
jgi:tetratricopeptide (TPR) repeat protein